MKIIEFTREFADTPGGRYTHEGEHSGQEFRETMLEPALRDNDKVLLRMNGAFGFPPSFIDEAFGVLVDHLGFYFVKDRLRIELSDDPAAVLKIESAMREHAGLAK